MPEFETGLSTHAANDVALTVSSDGGTYRKAKDADTRTEARRIIEKACLLYGREWYGRSFADSEQLAESVTYVYRAWFEQE
jgi:hypothetical protein